MELKAITDMVLKPALMSKFGKSFQPFCIIYNYCLLFPNVSAFVLLKTVVFDKMVKKDCFCSDPFDSNVQKAIEAEREETKNKHEFGSIFLSKSITG